MGFVNGQWQRGGSPLSSNNGLFAEPALTGPPGTPGGTDPKTQGMEWDPLSGAYQRSPTSVGTRVGQAQTGAYNAGPLSGLLAAGGGGSGGAGGAGGASGGTGSAPRPTVGWPGSGGSPFSTITSGPNNGMPPSGGGGGGSTGNSATDTQAAAFGRAKDQVGQQSRGAVNSLNDELASQGLSGSGAQVQGTKDVIQSGAENLANVSSGLATKAAENAITTRGQDIGQQEAQYSGQIQQRGQDIQAQQALADNQLRKQLASMGLLQQAMQGLTGAGASFQY